MPIQILGLRSFEDSRTGETKTHDAFHDKNWHADSLATIFRDLDKYLAAVPAHELWNLFYTLADCGDGKREFKSQDILAFDLDGVPEADRLRAADVSLSVLGLSTEKTVVVSSGGGVHLVAQLDWTLTKEDFKHHKLAYGVCCQKIDAALLAAGIEGKADSKIFEPRRILRLPGTMNRKPNKPERPCKILRGTLSPQPFDLGALSPTGHLGKEDSMPKGMMRRYPQTDTAAILQGCEFLKWAKAEAGKVDEPQWYAALSVVGRLAPLDGKDAHALAHELSAGHPSYTPEATNQKLEQATGASGPRTCANINALWGKCSTCAFNDKVVSPIQIVGPNTIATEHTGFHRIAANGKAVPAPGDLRRYFLRERGYKTAAKTRTVYVWNGTHYREMANNQIENYAHGLYLPEVQAGTLKSFRDLVTATETFELEWFAESTRGKIAFENGVLDVATGEFGPHSKAHGFRTVLPYAYEPGAKAPRFQQMLDLVTGNDATLQAILLEYMGYAVSGDDYWVHKALVLEGEGSNGKSTFIQVLQDLAGKEAYSTCSLKELDDEYARALFDGRLFNISDETPTKSLMDSSYFKAMASGSAVTARAPYKEPFALYNRAKFIFSCNELPRTADTSYGLFRRFLIVPFNQTITRKNNPDFDPHLAKKLRGELPGVFNMALEGYRRLHHQGFFTVSDASVARVKEYESTINSSKAWVKDEVVLLTNGHAEAFTPSQDFFDAYRQWCRSRELIPVTYDKFYKEFAKLIPGYEGRRSVRRWPEGKGGKTTRGLMGVGLVRDHTDSEHQVLHKEAPTTQPTVVLAPSEFEM